MKKRYYAHFAAVLILDVVNALTARYAFNSGSTLFLIISMLSLALAGYFFIRLMEDKIGIIANATWVALGSMNVTLASFLVFGEKITWLQGLGMTLIVIGLILTEYYAAEEAPVVNP